MVQQKTSSSLQAMKALFCIALWGLFFCACCGAPVVSNKAVWNFFETEEDPFTMFPPVDENRANVSREIQIDIEKMIREFGSDTFSIREYRQTLDKTVQDKDYMHLIMVGIAFSKSKHRGEYIQWAFSSLRKNADDNNFMLMYSVYCLLNYSTNKYAFSGRELDDMTSGLDKYMSPEIGVRTTKRFPDIVDLLKKTIAELKKSDKENQVGCTVMVFA